LSKWKAKKKKSYDDVPPLNIDGKMIKDYQNIANILIPTS